MFFDGQLVIQPEQPPDTLLPSAIDAGLIGENYGGTVDLLTALLGIVDVDDDNEPAPENIPTTSTSPNILSNEWGHSGICFCKQNSIANTPAKLVIPVDTTRDDINL